MPAARVVEKKTGKRRAPGFENAQQAGKQAGDPQKAARAIIAAVEAEAPTLRLPLGADAVAVIRTKLAAVAADVDRNEAAANATAF